MQPVRIERLAPLAWLALCPIALVACTSHGERDDPDVVVESLRVHDPQAVEGPCGVEDAFVVYPDDEDVSGSWWCQREDGVKHGYFEAGHFRGSGRWEYEFGSYRDGRLHGATRVESAVGETLARRHYDAGVLVRSTEMTVEDVRVRPDESTRLRFDFPFSEEFSGSYSVWVEPTPGDWTEDSMAVLQIVADTGPQPDVEGLAMLRCLQARALVESQRIYPAYAGPIELSVGSGEPLEVRLSLPASTGVQHYDVDVIVRAHPNEWTNEPTGMPSHSVQTVSGSPAGCDD